MAETETCESCRFWNPAWKFKKRLGGAPASGEDITPLEVPGSSSAGLAAKRTADRGQCRRYAPRASALTTVWMETRAWDWCGDYRTSDGNSRHAAE